jgi:hypothetical protein
MAGRNHLKRVQQALDALLAPQEPLAALDAARRLREAAEELEATKVEEVRATGVTWTKIGALYGMTKQGAQQRFGAEAAAARAAARSTRKP